MADPAPRFQVGDQCYTGMEAAGAAFVAGVKPEIVSHQFFPTDAGPRLAVLTAEGAHDWYEEENDGGGIDAFPPGVTWKLQSLDGLDAKTYGTPMTLQPCALDSEAEQRAVDAYELFGLLLLVLIIVWGGKQLLNLFTQDTEKA